MIDLTLRCPTCGRRADMCFDHGDDWKKRRPATAAAQKVARAARKAASARQGLYAAIREARAAGLPLRTIAAVAGLSHERIRQIVSD